MARTVCDTKLESRTSRLKLAAGKRHWRAITEGLALGYRRTAQGFGVWLARYFDEETGKYNQTRLGIADDHAQADGEQILTFSQAQKAAQGDLHTRNLIRSGKGYTIRDALADYLEWYEAKKKASGYRATKYATNSHILPKLGGELAGTLSADTIRRWHSALAKTPARVRSPVGKKRQFRERESEPRARKSTANRVLTILKSALNRAYRDDKVSHPDRWKAVAPFPNVDTAKVRFLHEDESKRLFNACEPHFRSIVQAALLTGARYGELCRLDAGDFLNDDRNPSILARETKSGKPRSIPLTPEGAQLFEDLTAGKNSSKPIFTREDGSRWGKSHQHRPMLEACTKASIKPTISFHILRHTYAAGLARKGVPLQFIAAALGHSDTRITEKFYAHLAPSHVADVIRANLPTLGIQQGNVRRFKAKEESAPVAIKKPKQTK